MRKEKRSYYFSVEGETEKWYLDWLQSEINTNPSAKYTVKMNSKIQKDPVSYAKGLTILGKTQITHIFDRESEEDVHVTQFQTTLDRMKEAQGLGKNITYNLGYSNFTFELWMILHKVDCNGSRTHRNQYLTLINKAYGENFENLDQYKHEKNFKRILRKLSLEQVVEAIHRAKLIMQRNEEGGFVMHHYKGYKYYKENPSLSLWESISGILNECQIM